MIKSFRNLIKGAVVLKMNQTRFGEINDKCPVGNLLGIFDKHCLGSRQDHICMRKLMVKHNL